MKALILAGGRGNRINEFSENQNKCMMPFRGKPLIQHTLERIAETDLSEIIIVVGYKAEDIINHYGKNDEDELSAPGVALLKARNKEMARQAENFNKKKFGKDTSVTIALGSVDPVSEATSLDDLRNVSMIQLRPPGKRERDS